MRRCFELISREKFIIFGIIVNLLWCSQIGNLGIWMEMLRLIDLAAQTKMKAKEQQRKMLINEKRTDK